MNAFVLADRGAIGRQGEPLEILPKIRHWVLGTRSQLVHLGSEAGVRIVAGRFVWSRWRKETGQWQCQLARGGDHCWPGVRSFSALHSILQSSEVYCLYAME